MNQAEFEAVFDDQWERCREVLVVKAAEYAQDSDRLHNFKVAATLQSCNEQQACGGFLAKHIVSIFDMIEENHDPNDVAKWDEKITDAMNYLILLQAILRETSDGITNDQISELFRR